MDVFYSLPYSAFKIIQYGPWAWPVEDYPERLYIVTGKVTSVPVRLSGRCSTHRHTSWDSNVVQVKGTVQVGRQLAKAAQQADANQASELDRLLFEVASHGLRERLVVQLVRLLNDGRERNLTCRTRNRYIFRAKLRKPDGGIICAQSRRRCTRAIA